MQIALTVATGFPCPHVVDRLVQAGHRVRCLCGAHAGFDESEHGDRTVEWLLGSVHDPEALASLVRDADAVLHIVSMLDQDDLEASVIVPMRVLLAAYAAGVPRFVYVSHQTAFELVLHTPASKRIFAIPAQA